MEEEEIHIRRKICRKYFNSRAKRKQKLVINNLFGKPKR